MAFLSRLNIPGQQHEPVLLATAAALPACTIAAQTLTENPIGGALTVDGVAVPLNGRVLVKDGAPGGTGAENGIYKQTVLGGGGTAWVLTRAEDAALGADLIQGCSVNVLQGTVNASKCYEQRTAGAITPGTTVLAFAEKTAPELIARGTTAAGINPLVVAVVGAAVGDYVTATMEVDDTCAPILTAIAGIDTVTVTFNAAPVAGGGTVLVVVRKP